MFHYLKLEHGKPIVSALCVFLCICVCTCMYIYVCRDIHAYACMCVVCVSMCIFILHNVELAAPVLLCLTFGRNSQHYLKHFCPCCSSSPQPSPPSYLTVAVCLTALANVMFFYLCSPCLSDWWVSVDVTDTVSLTMSHRVHQKLSLLWSSARSSLWVLSLWLPCPSILNMLTMCWNPSSITTVKFLADDFCL